MRGRFRFTTITGDDGRVVVVHSRSVSHLESYKTEEGDAAVRVVMNSGHSLYASGTLEEVMTELYGRSLKGQAVELYQSSACFLRKIFRKQA